MNITASELIQLLNQLLKSDPELINSLIHNRSFCKNDTALEFGIPVFSETSDEFCLVSFLGILNSLFSKKKFSISYLADPDTLEIKEFLLRKLPLSGNKTIINKNIILDMGDLENGED